MSKESPVNFLERAADSFAAGSSPRRPRLIVLVSGSGSNLQAILDAIAAGQLRAEIVLVVSNRKQAYGLVRAALAGIPSLYWPLKPYSDAGQSRQEYDADLATRLQAYHPDLIVLAGWMHVFSPAFLDRFANKVINLHPALPGTYPGVAAIERAYDDFRQGSTLQSGCMVHYVIPEVDAGPVIESSIVPFASGETLEQYQSKMHKAEHKLLVEAIRKVIQC